MVVNIVILGFHEDFKKFQAFQLGEKVAKGCSVAGARCLKNGRGRRSNQNPNISMLEASLIQIQPYPIFKKKDRDIKTVSQ